MLIFICLQFVLEVTFAMWWAINLPQIKRKLPAAQKQKNNKKQASFDKEQEGKNNRKYEIRIEIIVENSQIWKK